MRASLQRRKIHRSTYPTSVDRNFSYMPRHFRTPRTALNSVCSILVCLLASCTEAVPLRSSETNELNVTLLPSTPVARVLGGWIAGGPCSRNDYRCMNAVGLEYANKLRQAARVPLLRMGTERMLQVGRAHSKTMERRFEARGRKIFHQEIKKIRLGCNSWYAGENVGLNYVYKGRNNRVPSDPAKLCVAQFNKSPAHRKNMLDKTHTEAALGVWIDARDRIWCTHVLALRTRFTRTGACKRTPGWRTPHGRTGKDGHVFRGQKFTLRCSFAYGCRYCSARRCLTEKLSETVDRKLR